MHKIYVTEGIVLARRGVGEANTQVALFTKELGLVRATAKSARFEKSKLRYGLQSLTLARFSLVRGRNEWKIVGVENISQLLISASRDAKGASGRVSRLLLRLIHGEEQGEKLYSVVKTGFVFFANSSVREEIESGEWVLVLRILSHLGYVAKSEALMPFIEGEGEITGDLATKAREFRPFLLRAINESLAVSGL